MVHTVLLVLLKGVPIVVIKKLIRMFLILSNPMFVVLNGLFSRKMRLFYSLGLTFFILKFNMSHVCTYVKLLDYRHRILRRYRRLMNGATTAIEWKDLARAYEKKNKELFGPDRNTVVYDKQLIKKKMTQMEGHDKRNMHDFMNGLRLDLTRNIGNIAKKQLRDHYLSVPDTILKYMNKVKEQLKYIKESPDISKDEKIDFFISTRHSYGRTALLLSGGGSLGTFHLGIAKALFEHGLLPRIIAGTSVGAIIASIIAVRTDEELIVAFEHLDTFDLNFFSEHSTINLVRNFLEKGHFQDDKHLIEKLRTTLGDYTFQEAYTRTGRVLNVTVCPAETNETPKVLNYLSAPNVLIFSAVAASAAMPGLFPSQFIYAKINDGIRSVQTESLTDLYGRKWQDGSLQIDLPVGVLTEIFNCNYFIVSQCNPHILPALNLKKLVHPKFFELLEHEFKHRCRQLQLILPKWIPSKWLSLFTQTWEGDVTFLLPLVFYNPRRLITNPQMKELIMSVKLGEREAWQNMWTIECNCAIESYLDDIVKELCGHEMSWGLNTIKNNDPVQERVMPLVKIASYPHLANDHTLDFIDP